MITFPCVSGGASTFARQPQPGAMPWWLALFCLALAATPMRADLQTGNPALSADEIVRRSVLRDDQLRASRASLKCDRTMRTDRLDASGKVKDSKTVRTVHYPAIEMRYSTRVDAAKAADSTGADTVKSDRIETVMNLHKLAPRFDMALLGEEPIRGVPCYVIGYRPKASQPPAATREEKIISNLRGRFWMSKDDFSILQSEGTLVSPVTVALVASVHQLDFKYHSLTLPNGDTGPADFSVSLAVKAPFYDFRQRQVATEENWRSR